MALLWQQSGVPAAIYTTITTTIATMESAIIAKILFRQVYPVANEYRYAMAAPVRRAYNASAINFGFSAPYAYILRRIGTRSQNPIPRPPPPSV